MVLEIKQQLKLSQQLVMTPQLQQAIKLLQLSRMELASMIQQEIEQNPALEETTSLSEAESTDFEPGVVETPVPELEKTSAITMESPSALGQIDWLDYANEYESGTSYSSSAESSDLPSRLDILTKKPDLQTHLQWQLNFAHLTEDEKEVGLYVIGNLNPNGFLEVAVENIVEQTGCSEETALRMISEIQQMDPPGVGARDIRESLLLQLERLGLTESLAYAIVSNHIHLLENKNYKGIIKATGHNQHDVLAAIKIITDLDPYPGRYFSDEEPQYIIPDVYVYKFGDEFVILLNDEGLPRLRVSSYYKNILKNSAPGTGSIKDYVNEKLRSAAWLIKSIQQRQRTIYRVVESLIKFQNEFFEYGVSHLKPLVLRDVAEDIGMHESTISRVTNNKYVHTPQGTFELKYFFNTAIEQRGGDALSSESIKNRIRHIIQAENRDKPLSDNAIAEMFQEEGIKLARRTVAKYREQLGILPSKLRKNPNL